MEQSSPDTTSFSSESVAVREKRRELANGERGLQDAMFCDDATWESLPLADKADLDEFFFNAHSEFLRWEFPLDKSIKALEQRKIEIKTLGENVTDRLESIVQQFVARRDAGLLEGQDLDSAQRKMWSEIGQVKDTIKAKYAEIFSQADNYSQSRDLMQDKVYLLIERVVRAGEENGDIAGPIADFQALFDEAYGKIVPIMSSEVIQFHDGYHVLDLMDRANGDVGDKPSFLEAPDMETTMFDPVIAKEELFPTLFNLSFSKRKHPIPTVLLSEKLRREERDDYSKSLNRTSDMEPDLRIVYQRFVDQLSEPVKETLEERLKDFERYLASVLCEQALLNFPHAAEERKNALAHAFDDLTDTTRPSLYLETARVLFSDEQKGNSQVYAQQILRAIRKHDVGVRSLPFTSDAVA